MPIRSKDLDTTPPLQRRPTIWRFGSSDQSTRTRVIATNVSLRICGAKQRASNAISMSCSARSKSRLCCFRKLITLSRNTRYDASSTKSITASYARRKRPAIVIRTTMNLTRTMLHGAIQGMYWKGWGIGQVQLLDGGEKRHFRSSD